MAGVIKVRAHVVSHQSHGDGVYSLVLAPEKKTVSWNPGQFLHLALDDYDPYGGYWPESRVFSIASHPENKQITIVYSVKGSFTNRMSQELVPYSSVWLKLPFGDFTINSEIERERDLVLIAGGTGIAPFIPYFEQERQVQSGRRVMLVYGVRKPEHILFAHDLKVFLSTLPHFSLVLFVQSGEKNNEGFDQLNGIIDCTYVFEKSVELLSPVYYLSGPPSMIHAFKQDLASRGISVGSIKTDEWE